MTRWFETRPSRRLLACAAMVLGALATGCTEPVPLIDVFPADDPTLRAGSRSGPLLLPVNAPTRRLLPNDTSLPGENYLLSLPAPRFATSMSVARVLRASGPLPHPFEYVIHTDFTPLPGSGGTLAYVAAEPAEGVSCVIVAGTRGADLGIGTPMMMRNCVRGDTERALAPALHAS